MANYPQLDDCSGVWTLKEVNNAVMGGYWREAGNRMIAAGGQVPSDSDIIDFSQMAADGNFTDFGDLIQARDLLSGCGNQIRGVIGGGQTPSAQNIIDYVKTLKEILEHDRRFQKFMKSTL